MTQLDVIEEWVGPDPGPYPAPVIAARASFPGQLPDWGATLPVEVVNFRFFSNYFKPDATAICFRRKVHRTPNGFIVVYAREGSEGFQVPRL